ncbi:uncharacterized protein J8A68_001892 [[Candida] subhashii]|uniref:Long-chain-alcohol oxidase n=1 Tax=[Candida] subhashii TaxID=561895 RepID=A0A8J5QSW1_9ASCO|nr:uncharacterized protein J8A68_001892 [[Candida] subhashii]KAG7664597.1 hypothetical protein J8A68_001892 [[Candida] subhashii]
MLPVIAEDKHIETFLALADGIVHETSVENIKDLVSPDFPREKLEEYVKTFTRPSQTPAFKEQITTVFNKTPTSSVTSFVITMNALRSRIFSPLFTNSMTLITDMTLKQREELLASWRDSPVPLKRRLFRSIYSVTMSTFVLLANDLHLKAIGYPGRELRETLYKGQQVDPFRYEFLDKPIKEGSELHLPEIDALVIGSGSGAGVVAHTLAKEGYKSLVLEKGKYYHPSELKFNDYEGVNALYENSGTIASLNQQIFILAGSNFGGGSTVNWSMSLKTPFKVRKEWYDDFALDFVASDIYDECQNYVFEQMGVSDQNINTPSLANEVIIEGGKKLGYKSKVGAQNTGGHPDHSCGFCYLGCKFGVKQGATANWFRAPAENGSKFMQEVKVIQILHSNGIAIGVLCQDTITGIKFRITGPKKYIVAGGSLHTPIVLQNSGFKNRHIGKNLKLHPVSCVAGDFGKDVVAKAYEKPIMTSVCTEVDDLDGKAHGAKIETILNAPFIQGVFLPWDGSDATRRDILRYNNLTTMLLITRDKSSGSVRADPSKPEALMIDYTVNKYDRNALLQALLTASDMLYIQGAKRIISPQHWIPIFESNTPKEQRTIEDRDYVEWRTAVSKITLDSYGTAYGSAHQMSSCRMSGKGPKYGACDEKGRLFECSNIYIADSSAMPTASGANPMITTMAMARYVALNIAKDLRPKAKL